MQDREAERGQKTDRDHWLRCDVRQRQEHGRDGHDGVEHRRHRHLTEIMRHSRHPKGQTIARAQAKKFRRLIGNGCDVVFGVAANGALLAAKESNLLAIGADVDQYNTYPEVKDALISSAQKNVDAAVYNYLKTVADGSVKAGIRTATLQNGGVGLAPFHDWDSKIPADLKAQIQKASDGIKDGSIRIDL